MMDDDFVPVGGHLQLTGLSGVRDISLPADATHAWIQAITQNVRIAFGTVTAPTSSTGFQIKAGDPPVRVRVWDKIQVIEETASATLEYQPVRRAR